MIARMRCESRGRRGREGRRMGCNEWTDVGPELIDSRQTTKANPTADQEYI